MSALVRPGIVASALAAAALALHPALGASRLLPAHEGVLAALLLLALLALGVRAASARESRAGAALVAAGAALLVGALAVDGVRGHHGTMTLAAGQSQGNFDETAPDGRSLGLRPLGFPIGAERISATGSPSGPRVALAVPGRSAPLELTPDRSVAFGGYRFARPTASLSGGVARLRVAASDGASTQVVDIAPGEPGQAFGLTISLEEYFPDFALDENRQPFSRSAEPRNPAALLRVEKGGQARRVFVLQSMPGIHRLEDLGLAFSLLGVEPERMVTIAVHREPAAFAALAGALLLAAGVALVARVRPAVAGGVHQSAVALAGAVLVALLLLAGRGGVLAWSFVVVAGGGPVSLPGVGVLFGVSLVAALAGTLLALADPLAGGVARARPVARGALWLAVGAAVCALALAVVRVSELAPAAPAVLSLGAVALSVAWLVASLLASKPKAPRLLAGVARLALPLAVLAAVAIAIVVGVLGLLRDGTYATPAAAACASAGLLGLAALEPTRAAGLRRFAFALFLLAPAVS
jgi:hypothetical protein